tara:strand:+ start:1066 stop:2037 length:972 start_codon:yes stop_codon:yes gene_type:complete
LKNIIKNIFLIIIMSNSQSSENESPESENNNSLNNYSISQFYNSNQSINSNNYAITMNNLENNTNSNYFNSSTSNEIISSSYYSNHIVNLIGNTNLNLQLNNSVYNFINSESSIEEEQTTDYNNEEGIITNYDNELSNEEQQIYTTNNYNQWSGQYSMLYNEDMDNPFFKCNVKNLDYETDDDEKIMTYRIIYFWNYEFNYDYFSINDIYIFNNKTELFKSKLNELKSIRNNFSNNRTGNIIKIESNKKFSSLVNIYLIIYYDNAKSNIEFYGMFNQEIDENKLIENIKRESIFGKNGIVSSNLMTNLGENDFIILHKKINII